MGNPTTQYTRIETPPANGQGASWSKTYFDGLGRAYKLVTRGPSGLVNIVSEEVTFDARGSIFSAASPRFAGETAYWTRFDYDSRNRLIEKTLPDGAAVRTIHGHRSTTVLNPENKKTVTRRSTDGLTTYLDEYLGTTAITTTTQHDPVNRRQMVLDQAGNTWETLFDSLGQVLHVDDPDAGLETRQYNDSGELVGVRNALGEETELRYDLLGRLISKTTRKGTSEEEVTRFGYDEEREGYFNIGFLTSMSDSAGRAESNYDAAGRLKKEERVLDGERYWKQYAYLASGHLRYTWFVDGKTIYRWYDGAGNLRGETGTINQAVYNAAGQPVRMSYVNGVETTNDYSESRGWVESVETTKDGTFFQDLAYTYTADGMVKTLTSGKEKESWQYAYDGLNRLSLAVNVDTPGLTQSFEYDTIGNITYNSAIGVYSYPSPGNPRPHAVQSAGSRTYQYDSAGRMTSRNGTLIQWNGDGKPSSIGNIGFTYDGLGNRLKKVSGGETTRYPFPDYEVGPDGIVTKYLTGGKQVGSSFFIYHRDHLGSIQSITDSSGKEVKEKKYGVFGDTYSNVGEHVEYRGWIGEREEETELVYLNARYYDPELGRFVSPDPIATLGQGLNRYTYSLNNPVNFLDPSGLLYWDDAFSPSDQGVIWEFFVTVSYCYTCGTFGPYVEPGVYVDPVEPDVSGGVWANPDPWGPSVPDDPGEPDQGYPGGGDGEETGGDDSDGTDESSETNPTSTPGPTGDADPPRRETTTATTTTTTVRPTVVPVPLMTTVPVRTVPATTTTNVYRNVLTTPDHQRALETLAGAATIGVGLSLVQAGVATAGGGPVGMVGGAFWVGVGVATIGLGYDVIEGNGLDHTSAVIDFLLGNSGSER